MYETPSETLQPPLHYLGDYTFRTVDLSDLPVPSHPTRRVCADRDVPEVSGSPYLSFSSHSPDTVRRPSRDSSRRLPCHPNLRPDHPAPTLTHVPSPVEVNPPRCRDRHRSGLPSCGPGLGVIPRTTRFLTRHRSLPGLEGRPRPVG